MNEGKTTLGHLLALASIANQSPLDRNPTSLMSPMKRADPVLGRRRISLACGANASSTVADEMAMKCLVIQFFQFTFPNIITLVFTRYAFHAPCASIHTASTKPSAHPTQLGIDRQIPNAIINASPTSMNNRDSTIETRLHLEIPEVTPSSLLTLDLAALELLRLISSPNLFSVTLIAKAPAPTLPLLPTHTVSAHSNRLALLP